jgi:uncharacterized protein YndB with AHSA1/START domain
MLNPATRISTPSEREVTVTRSFNAPRRLVFEAHTNPELVKRWLYGPAEWPLVHCEIELRVGGRLRYVWRHAQKGEIGMSGTFRTVEAPAHLVHTELFDEDWTGGEAIATTDFIEEGAMTTVAVTMLYSSAAARDKAMKSGMLDGWSQCLDRLEELLAHIPATQS